MDAQHEQMIFHLECITSYVIVLIFDVKFDKFNPLYKNITINLCLLSYIHYQLGHVFPIMACVIAYAIFIMCITFPNIHLIVQTSRHLLTMHEFPSR